MKSNNKGYIFKRALTHLIHREVAIGNQNNGQNNMKSNDTDRFYLVGLITICLLILFLIFRTTPIYASENNNETNKEITNIGFLKEPPKELVDKFPMCDEFLKVEWLNEQKRIGIAHYETYTHKGIKNEGIKTAFVYLNGVNYSHSLDSYQTGNSERIPITNNLNYLTSLIKEDDSNKMPSPFRDDGRVGPALILSDIVSFGPTRLTLADNRLIVCVPFPDSTRVYFAELPLVVKLYSEKEIDKQYEEVKHIFMADRLKDNPNFPRKVFPNIHVIDVNSDGVKDYFRHQLTMYSREDRGFFLIPNEIYDSTCESDVPSGFNGPELTTDGKNFYVFETCNITTLSKEINQEYK